MRTPPGWALERLEAAGCVAAPEEATELVAAAERAGAARLEALEALVARREHGEPLAWITGGVDFAGRRVLVHPGVYVPRWQTERLVDRAAEALPERGLAVDLCTGSGALAAALGSRRPGARVLATEIDRRACRCAAANGVETYHGSMADPLPAWVAGHVDVVTAVVPYVPTEALRFLPRDVQAHEPLVALDGGAGGLRLLQAAVRAAGILLRPGGTVLLEVGGEQDRRLAKACAAAGLSRPLRLLDGDGDLCGVEATRVAP